MATMGGRVMTNEQRSLERDVVSVFGNCVGVDTTTVGNPGCTAKLAYDNVVVDFIPTEIVTGTTSGAVGTVVSIATVAGRKIMTLNTLGVALFQDNEAITGDVAGDALVDGVLHDIDGVKLLYDGGSTLLAAGDIIIGVTSTATAMVLEVSGTAVSGTLKLGETTVAAWADNEVINQSGGDATAAVVNGLLFANPVSVKGKGIAGITSPKEGRLVIELDKAWAGLLMFKSCVLDSNATADDHEITVVSETVATTRLVTVDWFDNGALLQPAPDKKLYFELVLSNTAQTPAGF